MGKSVLNSGKSYDISPKDGTKTKKEVSEAFKQSKNGEKYNPLSGGGEKVTASVQIHDNKPNSWVKGGASGKPKGPSDPARKKVSYS